MDAAMEQDMKENAIPDFVATSKGGLAIVTGGCSGMGLAFAEKAVRCGMHAVVLDMDESLFAETEAALEQAGAAKGQSLLLRADVSSPTELNRAAGEVATRFPPSEYPISLICANAGYGAEHTLLGAPVEMIQRQFDVLCMGVIWTFKAFQERFLAQNEPCALVATSSIRGIVPAVAVYGVGKRGAVAVMESLHEELWNRNARHVKCHVLCPGVVTTNIGQQVPTGGARRPKRNPATAGTMPNASAPNGPVTKERAYALAMGELFQSRGQPASHLADEVFAAIESGRFYIVVDMNRAPYLDAGMSMHALEDAASRHRREEVGAPPPHPYGSPAGGVRGAIDAVVARRDEILKERGEAPSTQTGIGRESRL